MQVSRYQTHSIELIIDRLMINKDAESRLTESLEIALKLGESVVMILSEEQSGTWTESLYSTLNTCPQCGTGYDTLAPNAFSFNSPFGACEDCEGLGIVSDFSEDLLIPNPKLSLAEGAIGPLGKKRKTQLWDQIIQLSKQLRFDLTMPYEDLPKNIKSIIMNGSRDTVEIQVPGTRSMFKAHIRFSGIIAHYREIGRAHV